MKLNRAWGGCDEIYPYTEDDSAGSEELVRFRWNDSIVVNEDGDRLPPVSKRIQFPPITYLSSVRLVVEKPFRELAQQWQKDTGGMSLMTQRAIHPAYQRIIGMGKEVIVLLLQELQNDPDDWFWALEAITGVRPTKPEDAGDLDMMAQSWIQWGKDNNYIV
ncbi:MAG: hypothetical protein JNJ94_09895 [Chlorobi bacterium]|jgi:hypothetical protein|nr:hypothetical protein [Chlorobiota bacterium]